MKELIPALGKAITKIGNATKNSTNPHFKSGYANLESVIFQIKSPLEENDLFYTQTFHASEHTNMLILTIYHKEGESLICGSLGLPTVNKDNPQALKSSITLLRRAQLLAFFGMAEVDDDGNSANGFEPVQRSEAPKEEKKEIKNHAPQKGGQISEPRVKRAYAIAKSKGIKSMELDIICQKLYGQVVHSLSIEEYNQLCDEKLNDEGIVNLLQDEINF